MLNFNPNGGSANQQQMPKSVNQTEKINHTEKNDNSKFGDVVKDKISEVNQLQDDSAAAVKDLLVGRNQDVNSVVAEVAKSDMSFKMLVGVRNKMIEAYKETMRMQI